MSSDNGHRFDAAGVAAVVIAAAVGGGWATVIIVAAVTGLPVSEKSGSLLNSIGQVLAGAVAAFIGSRMHRHGGDDTRPPTSDDLEGRRRR